MSKMLKVFALGLLLSSGAVVFAMDSASETVVAKEDVSVTSATVIHTPAEKDSTTPSNQNSQGKKKSLFSTKKAKKMAKFVLYQFPNFEGSDWENSKPKFAGKWAARLLPRFAVAGVVIAGVSYLVNKHLSNKSPDIAEVDVDVNEENIQQGELVS